MTRQQMLRLMCVDCSRRFRKRAIHFSELKLGKERLEQIKAIRCPACGSANIDSDPDQPSGR